MRIDDLTFRELMDLVEHGPDTFVGLAPRYPWGRLFGGHVVAQGLRAAQLTVDPAFRVHSLHAYFLRGGTHREPVRFEVDRIRNGRSFTTRRVVARQSNGAILSLSASFQVAEEQAEVQPASLPEGVPGPDEVEDTGWGGMLERRPVVSEFARTVNWMRLRADDIGPADGWLATCGLAFVSDSAPTGSVRATHPIQVPRARRHEVFTGASLDHAVFFQRPVDPTGWLLVETDCHRLQGGRGTTVGRVFDRHGVQVATVVQEVLMRERRERGGGPDGLGGKDV